MPFTPGGFIGVDVFFVISGFLITGLLMREVERSNHIHYLDIIARRARRLLPAALVVIAFVDAASVLVYPPLKRLDVMSATREIGGSPFLTNDPVAAHETRCKKVFYFGICRIRTSF